MPVESPNYGKCLTAKEAAHFLGVSQRFLNRLTTQGTLAEIYGPAHSDHRTRYGYKFEDFYSYRDLEQIKVKLKSLRRSIMSGLNGSPRCIVEDELIQAIENEGFAVACTDDDWPDTIDG